jgi:hypothetical protein
VASSPDRHGRADTLEHGVQAGRDVGVGVGGAGRGGGVAVRLRRLALCLLSRPCRRWQQPGPEQAGGQVQGIIIACDCTRGNY